MIYEDEILVLREIPYKENDKILHVFSRLKGKIQVMSRGCRKNSSKLINVSQIFAYSKCMLYKSKDMYIIDSADLVDNFYSLRENIDAFMYGSYILELINYVACENDVDSKIFEMTIKILLCLSLINDGFDKLTVAYELKLTSMLGYKPEFFLCACCRNTINKEASFSIQEGGFICDKCKTKSDLSINMTYDEILTMERILKTKFENIISIENIDYNIMDIVRKFLFHCIGKDNFNTIKLLRKGDING